MIFNFGSINIDHVYRVANLPKPGETIACLSHNQFLGGKGINQSIAISKAQGDVSHIGAVGYDGEWALSQISEYGVSTQAIAKRNCPTGHAIVCVREKSNDNDEAENQIIISGAANQALEHSQIDDALSNAQPSSDWVVLQNETNLAEEIVAAAASKDIRVAYVAAPFDAKIAVSLLEKIELLAVNEGEAQALADVLEIEPEKIPTPKLIITKGSKGSVFIENDEEIFQPAFSVDAVDTTGAGDTFFGSFLALYCETNNAKEALRYAAAASALQVTRAGAAHAIPAREAVISFMKENPTL